MQANFFETSLTEKKLSNWSNPFEQGTYYDIVVLKSVVEKASR